MCRQSSDVVPAGVIMAAVGLIESYEAEVSRVIHFFAARVRGTEGRPAQGHPGVSAGEQEWKFQPGLDVRRHCGNDRGAAGFAFAVCSTAERAQ